MIKNLHVFRKWHSRIGVLLVLPLVTVATTGILMGHMDDLGLKKMIVPWDLSWLPAYSSSHGGKNNSLLTGIQVTLNTPDGCEWIGAKNGLFLWCEGELRRVHGLHTHNIHSIRLTDGNDLLIASQTGVWIHTAHDWRQIYSGEAEDAQMLPTHAVRIVSPDKGIMETTDLGLHWIPDAELNHILVQTPMAVKSKPLTARQLVEDIHTGQFIFGSEWRWLWIDLLAVSLISLTLFGLVLWSQINQARKKAAALK